MGEFLSSLYETVNPAHTAVVVVDMQNDFCAESGVAIPRCGLDQRHNQENCNADDVECHERKKARSTDT